MLRTRVRRLTQTVTGTAMTVTHGLGAVPEVWHLEPTSDKGLGRCYVVPGTVLTNTINIMCSVESAVTVDVFCQNYQGRLY